MCLLKGTQAAQCGEERGQEGNSNRNKELDMVEPEGLELRAQEVGARELGDRSVCCTRM